MRVTTQRQRVLSLKIPAEIRRFLEETSARWTLRNGRRYTLTDVVEVAIRDLMKREEKRK